MRNPSETDMGSSPHSPRDSRRIGNIRRSIFLATKDADYFHKLALQYRVAQEEGLAEKALAAEKTCRKNISDLERELKECS